MAGSGSVRFVRGSSAILSAEAYPKRLLFPTNVERDHNLMVLATAAVLTAIAAGVALKLRNKLIFLLSGLGIFAFVYYYITKMGGYPFNPAFVGFTDLMVGLILVLCFAKIRKRINSAA